VKERRSNNVSQGTLLHSPSEPWQCSVDVNLMALMMDKRERKMSITSYLCIKYTRRKIYSSTVPFEFLSTNKTAGPATIFRTDRSLLLEVASANTVPDTLVGITTLEFSSIATNRMSSEDWNAIKVALTEVEGRCTATVCPGMEAPVMLKDGKVVKCRGGLVDGHETMNGDANVKASSALIGVYDSMN
jgi:hypothetical protein